jgi:hypothetical protein
MKKINKKKKNTQLRQIVQKLYKPALFYFAPALILTAAIVFGSIPTNHYFSHIQDDILYRYLFQDFKLNDIIVPLNHANILKYPLYILQALLPYNPTTLAIVNFGLMFAMVIPLVLLFTYVLGKKLFPLICILFATLIFSSVSFNLNVMETTIRNIEYPIGIAFILALSLIVKRGFNKRTVIIAALSSILMAVSIAGDTLLLYVFCGAPLLTLLIIWLKNKTLSRTMLLVGAAVLATALLSILIRKAIAFIGIANYYLSSQFETRIAPYELLGPGFTKATEQLLGLFGADIFGLSVSASFSIFFINFALFIIGIIGVVLMIRASLKKKPLAIENTKFDYSFFNLSLAFSAIIVFIAYIFAGQVLYIGADGEILNANQERYITLIPIVLVFAIVFIIKHYYNSLLIKSVLATGLIVAMALSTGAVLDRYDPYVKGADARNANATAIGEVARSKNIDLLVTSDNMGSVIQFWSSNAATYAPLMECDQWFPYNTRMSWRGIDDNRDINRTALVVDRGGIDGPIWNTCSDSYLEELFGSPNEKSFIDDKFSTTPIEIWVYDQDIRSKINN